MRKLAQVLRRAGLVLTLLFAVGGMLFASGYAVDDPGGWQAAAIIAAMVVPLAWLTRDAVRVPQRATVEVMVGIGLLVVLALAEVVVNVEAPVLPVAALVLAVPAAVLGQRNARHGGELLLLVAAAPLLSVLAQVLDRSGEGPPLGAALGGSTGAVVLPLVALGVLFLVAAAVDRQHPSDEYVLPTPAGTGRHR